MFYKYINIQWISWTVRLTRSKVLLSQGQSDHSGFKNLDFLKMTCHKTIWPMDKRVNSRSPHIRSGRKWVLLTELSRTLFKKGTMRNVKRTKIERKRLERIMVISKVMPKRYFCRELVLLSNKTTLVIRSKIFLSQSCNPMPQVPTQILVSQMRQSKLPSLVTEPWVQYPCLLTAAIRNHSLILVPMTIRNWTWTRGTTNSMDWSTDWSSVQVDSSAWGLA